MFDRGESGFEVCLPSSLLSLPNTLTHAVTTKCKDIYFHSDRQGVTFRIYKLLECQVEMLWKFLRPRDLDPSAARASPLPILGDKNNRDRVDPDDAIDSHHIFRDRWERKIPVRDAEYYRNQRCVRHALDYPEIEEQKEATDAFWARQQRSRSDVTGPIRVLTFFMRVYLPR